jgi:hypothetical protein
MLSCSESSLSSLGKVPAALRSGGLSQLDYPRHAFDAPKATLIYKNAVNYRR